MSQALQSRLEAAEARALAAERAIELCLTSASGGMSSGHALHSLMERSQGIDMDKAREILRKAEEWDALAAQNVQLREALEYMEENLAKSDYIGDCLHCGSCQDCKDSCPLPRLWAALALPLPESARQVQEWKSIAEAVIDTLTVNWIPESAKENRNSPEKWRAGLGLLVSRAIAEHEDPLISEKARQVQEWREKAEQWEDLTMLVRRLTHRLSNHDPNSMMVQQSQIYLAKIGGNGSVLRAAKEAGDGK
jgi:ferredoxin